MLASDHDHAGLRAVLHADFQRLLRNATRAEQFNGVIEHLLTATRSILCELSASWNSTNAVAIPPELLASSFALLPFRDRVACSHVSRAWRHAALLFPAVWSHIDLESNMNLTSELFDMAVSRAGQLPIDLRFHQLGPSNIRMLRALRVHGSRCRTISWYSSRTTDPFPYLTEPAPLLESLITNLEPEFGQDFLGDTAGKLRTLHVGPLSLTYPCPAFSTVTDLQGDLPAYEGSFSSLFDLFPSLQRLTLRALDDNRVDWLPHGPPPPSLEFLCLCETDDHQPCDLAARYLSWRTEALREFYLGFWLPITIFPTASMRALLSESRELDIVLPEGNLKKANSQMTLVDALGRTCCIQPYRSHSRRDASDAYGGLLYNCPVDDLRVLAIDSTFLPRICDRPPPELSRLTLRLQELDIGLNPPGSPRRHRSVYAWDSLKALAQLPELYPKLESVVVEMHALDDAPDVEDVQELLGIVAPLGLLDVPSVHVRGVPAEAAAEAGRNAGLDEGAVRAVFGL